MPASLYYLIYFFVKYLPKPLGNWLRSFIVRLFIKSMGRKVVIAEGVTIDFPSNIIIGDNVSIHEQSIISAYNKITIGDNTRIGHRCSILTTDHIYSNRKIPIYKQGVSTKPVVIKENVWVGCNVTILKGVIIGKGAIIAAGAVVNKDVSENTIVGGVPARGIKLR